MGFESRKEKFDPEVLHLAENFLQLHFSKVQTHNPEIISPTDAGSDETRMMLTEKNIESGNGFRGWFNSPEGKAIMREYVSTHSLNEISKFTDMEKLEELYLQFKNRTLH